MSFDEAVASYRAALAEDPPLEAWRKIHDGLRVQFSRLEIERIKKAAKDSGKARRMACTVCGDEFTMPKTAIGARQKVGQCTGCYGQAQTERTSRAGRTYWADGVTSIGRRHGFTSRAGPG